MAAPANTFKIYPHINEAYGKVRKLIISLVKDFNNSNPNGEGYFAFDLPVMDYVHSCIPSRLNPEPLGTSTKDIQDRIRSVLYPLLQQELLCDREFAVWLGDDQRAAEFIREWLNQKKPSKPRGEQPRYGLEDFIKANLIGRDAILILRVGERDYNGTIKANFGVEIDLGSGPKKYKSPNAVISKGLDLDLSPWKCFWVKDLTGQEVLLETIKRKYEGIRAGQSRKKDSHMVS